MIDGVKNAAGRCANLCRKNYFRVIFSDVCNATAILLMVITLGTSSTSPKDAFSWSKFKLTTPEKRQRTAHTHTHRYASS